MVVSNVAPTATFSFTAGREGTTRTLSLTDVVEPSATDRTSLQYGFDCGAGFGRAVDVELRLGQRGEDPGGTSTTTLPPSGHRYGTPGTYTLRISIGDDRGAGAAAPVTIAVSP